MIEFNYEPSTSREVLYLLNKISIQITRDIREKYGHTIKFSQITRIMTQMQLSGLELKYVDLNLYKQAVLKELRRG